MVATFDRHPILMMLVMMLLRRSIDDVGSVTRLVHEATRPAK